MKRLLLILFCAVTLSGWVMAQEPPQAPKEGEAAQVEQQDEGDKYAGWKWANFAILAIALGYMLGKALPPFFASRTATIQKGIAEASKMRSDAEARARAIEQRMASLQSEIDRIKAEAAQEMAKEADRLQQETAQQMQRIQAQAQMEIEALTKHATAGIKARAAELAVQLAEQRLREQLNPAAQGMLVDRFVRQLSARSQEAHV